MASLTTVETSYGSGGRPLGLMTWAQLQTLDKAGLRAGDTADISDLNYGVFVWNGTLWKPRGIVLVPYVITLAALTGTVVETTMATATVPANAMGTVGSLRVTLAGSAPANNANAKTLRTKFGGVSYQSISIANNLSAQAMAHIRNVTATSQKAFNGSFSASAGAPLTSAINTAADVPVLVTGQLGLGTDTLSLDGLTIELLP